LSVAEPAFWITAFLAAFLLNAMSSGGPRKIVWALINLGFLTWALGVLVVPAVLGVYAVHAGVRLHAARAGRWWPIPARGGGVLLLFLFAKVRIQGYQVQGALAGLAESRLMITAPGTVLVMMAVHG